MTPMIRKFYLFVYFAIFIALIQQGIYAQTPLNGILNKYTPVTKFECDSTLLTVKSAVGFATGQKVLMIQMQGAIIDTTDSANFGNILDLNGAGNYEFNRIHSVSGDKIQLKYGLTKSYELTGRVQLIFVPEYNNATVNNVTCLPWDGEIGGVIAIDVSNELTMAPTGTLNASGKGFRGGLVIDSQGPFVNEFSYFYGYDPKASANKGEGISIVSLGKSFGRGKAANGGGGGNSINSGGAGGGNGGKGGDGGWHYYNTPNSPTFGTNGVPGLSVFTNDNSRIAMGGGGGAGHENDQNGTSGGIGGGIIIVKAGSIKANNRKFVANGQDIVQGDPGNDGQGGGGAGGTIFIETSQITGTLTCEMKGGLGGNCIFSQVPTQIIGAGGGGAGGKLILSQPFSGINTNLDGGINGIGNQNMTNGATPGESGIIKTGLNLPIDTVLAWIVKPITVQVDTPDCNIDKGAIEILNEIDVLYSINSSPTQASGLFSNLSPGTYLIELFKEAGCKKDTTITILPQSVTNTLLSRYFCQGDTTFINGIPYTDDAIAIDTAFNTAGCDTIQTIVLFFGDYIKKSQTISFCAGSSLVFDGVTYTAEAIVKDTIYSAFACDTILTTTLVQNPLPTLLRTVTLCPGQSIVIGGKEYFKAGMVIDTLNTQTSEGCDTVRTTDIAFFVVQTFFLSADTSICAGEKIRLESQFSNTTWSTGGIGGFIEVTNPGIYIGTAFNEDNCPVLDTVVVNFCCKDRGIYIPNVFSPNDDGKNDIFKAEPLENCQNYTLFVWDRWGTLIFETKDYEKGWDGTFRGKPAPAGVYIWIIEFNALNSKGNPIILKGDVTLVK